MGFYYFKAWEFENFIHDLQCFFGTDIIFDTLLKKIVNSLRVYSYLISSETNELEIAKLYKSEIERYTKHLEYLNYEYNSVTDDVYKKESEKIKELKSLDTKINMNLFIIELINKIIETIENHVNQKTICEKRINDIKTILSDKDNDLNNTQIDELKFELAGLNYNAKTKRIKYSNVQVYPVKEYNIPGNDYSI